jgi:hypothetical protein
VARLGHLGLLRSHLATELAAGISDAPERGALRLTWRGRHYPLRSTGDGPSSD